MNFNRKAMRKKGLIAFATLAVLSAVVSSARLVGANRPKPKPASQEATDDDTRRRQGKASKEGGMRAAAAVKGTYRVTMSPHPGRNASTLDFLAEHSPLIVIGQMQSNRGWLNKAGDTITTDYVVAAERCLKGNARPGDRLTVSVLGGRVGFEDGSWAQIDTPGMTPPFNNENYVLFLEPSYFEPTAEQRAASRGPIYTPSFMSLSMYLIDEGGIINPKAFPSHPLAKAYAGKTESQRAEDVLRVVGAQEDRRRKN